MHCNFGILVRFDRNKLTAPHHSLVFFKFSFFASLFDNELAFVDRLIEAGLRNYSAWNQQYSVLNPTGFTPEVV